jgi:hypothetical protein
VLWGWSRISSVEPEPLRDPAPYLPYIVNYFFLFLLASSKQICLFRVFRYGWVRNTETTKTNRTKSYLVSRNKPKVNRNSFGLYQLSTTYLFISFPGHPTGRCRNLQIAVGKLNHKRPSKSSETVPFNASELDRKDILPSSSSKTGSRTDGVLTRTALRGHDNNFKNQFKFQRKNLFLQ